MKIYKLGNDIILCQSGQCRVLGGFEWDEFINRRDLHGYCLACWEKATPAIDEARMLAAPIDPPVGGQEIWAAGVTYLRSRTARMEESLISGGSSFYDKVYEAERPELFFKATARRTVGHLDKVNIRKDSGWDVPEPELTLFMTSEGSIVAYTIGNDMSSRSIEGENPLYLPQAKCYDRSASIGPCLYIPGESISPDTEIAMNIRRNSVQVFVGRISIRHMKRSHSELASYLFRECSFPQGVFLMTGTCIVPDNDFTLCPNDEIQISIDGIGTLINYVA